MFFNKKIILVYEKKNLYCQIFHDFCREKAKRIRFLLGFMEAEYTYCRFIFCVYIFKLHLIYDQLPLEYTVLSAAFTPLCLCAHRGV